MKSYELTYIISSQITSQEADNLKKDIETFIQEKGGIILKSDLPAQTGKTIAKTLAYPIKKQSSGYFVILTFQISESERTSGNKIKEIKEKLEKESKILRHFIILKKPMKELKERRTRKSLFMQEKAEKFSLNKVPSFVRAMKDKLGGKEESVKIEDIDKKLDEILNE